MKKLIKYLKIGSCVFALTGIVFGGVFMNYANKNYSIVFGANNPQEVTSPNNTGYYTTWSELDDFKSYNFIYLNSYASLTNYKYVLPFKSEIVSYGNINTISLYKGNPSLNERVEYRDGGYIESLTLSQNGLYANVTIQISQDEYDNQSYIVFRYNNIDDFATMENIVLFNAIFNKNNTIYEPSFQTSDTIRTLKFYAWYFSIYSPVNLQVNLYDNLYSYINGLSAFNPSSILDNKAVYTSDTTAQNIGRVITPIFKGGIYANNRFFNGLYAIYTQIYSNANIQVRSTPLSNEFEQSISGDNINYKGYFFLEAVYLTTDTDSPLMIYKTNYTYYDNKLVYVLEYSFSDLLYKNMLFLHSSYELTGSANASADSYWYRSMNYPYIISQIGEVTQYDSVVLPSDYGSNVLPFRTIFSWINTAMYGFAPLLSFQVFPSITLGAVLFVPLVVTLLLFIIRLFKR